MQVTLVITADPEVLRALDRLSEALGMTPRPAEAPKRRKGQPAQDEAATAPTPTPGEEPKAAEPAPTPAPSAAEPPVAGPDKHAARQALIGYVQRNGKEKGLKLLSEFGVSAFSDLKPEQYADLAAKCNA